MVKFTINFDGSHAQELKDAFFGCFWDGGLDQYLEGSFLEEYGLTLDDVDYGENGNPIINTDNATI
ncbi:MAG: hypothetical protein RSF81_00325 [Oscillospiraceae bacterium]